MNMLKSGALGLVAFFILIIQALRTTVTNVPTSGHDPILGAPPELLFGNNAPDSDAHPWKQQPLGSVYYRRSAAGIVGQYTKVEDERADVDWAGGVQVIQQTVAIADFTDGGGASGYVDLTVQIPVGAWVLRAVLLDVTGFTGNTTAVATLGDGTDVDRYNASTLNVVANAQAIDGGAPSGTQVHATAATVRVTITGASDFGLITAGQMTVRLYILN